jgi:alkylhydroperoxidase family enzyme
MPNDHGASLRLTMRDQQLAQAIIHDWREADIDVRLPAVLTFAAKLTLDPRSMRQDGLGAALEEDTG